MNQRRKTRLHHGELRLGLQHWRSLAPGIAGRKVKTAAVSLTVNLKIVDRRVDRDMFALGDGADDIGAADDADDGAVVHYR